MSAGLANDPSVVRGVNLILYEAFRRKTRHLSVSKWHDGIQVAYLGGNPSESIQELLPLDAVIQRLRVMSQPHDQILITMGSWRGRIDAVFPAPGTREPLILHLSDYVKDAT